MHPGPSRWRVGVSYFIPHDVWGALPVEYRKLEIHFKCTVNNLLACHQNNNFFTLVMVRQLEFSYLNSFDCQITPV